MDKKKELEKKIIKEFMQKDKERIIDLYLQMKFEKDIFEQQTEELKAENERLRHRNKHLKSKKSIAERDAEIDLLTQERNIFIDKCCEFKERNERLNKDFLQQLKEKDEEIEKLKDEIILHGENEQKNIAEFVSLTKKKVCDEIRHEILQNSNLVYDYIDDRFHVSIRDDTYREIFKKIEKEK